MMFDSTLAWPQCVEAIPYAQPRFFAAIKLRSSPGHSIRHQWHRPFSLFVGIPARNIPDLHHCLQHSDFIRGQLPTTSRATLTADAPPGTQPGDSLRPKSL
jgi:hypothetical protein